MTVTITHEEQVRSALRRLNPEFHEHDASWEALQEILDERTQLRTLIDDTIHSLRKEPELGRDFMAREIERRLADI